MSPFDPTELELLDLTSEQWIRILARELRNIARVLDKLDDRITLIEQRSRDPRKPGSDGFWSWIHYISGQRWFPLAAVLIIELLAHTLGRDGLIAVFTAAKSH